MNKVCNKCKSEKPLDDFSDLKGGKLGKRPECKKCRNAWAKSYYNKNSEGILERQKSSAIRRGKYDSHHWRAKKYGLSKEVYESMLFNQSNSCKICRKETKLVVDHCHKTGKIRGLLCVECNKGLGSFVDSVVHLANAIKYLES